MKTDARLILKRKQQNSANVRTFTDAREILKMKYNLQKKHLGPVSRAAAMGTIKLRKNNNVMQNNFGRGRGVKKFVTNNQRYMNNRGPRFIRQNFQKPYRSNFEVNRSRFQTENRTRFQTENRTRFQTENRTRFQTENRTRSQMEAVAVLRNRFRTQLRDKGVTPRVPPNKFVRSSGNGIIVTTKNTTFQSNRRIIEGEDELERTTLDDLPEVQNLPSGLLASKKVAQWVTPSARPPVTSRLHLGNETMHADAVASLGSGHERNKVVVSNLMPTVTEEDIGELFGDIGPLLSARLTRPGEALITYASAVHAAQAVQGYNNILLDGQAMRCFLLPNQERPTMASRLGDRYLPSTSTAPVPPQSSASFFQSALSSYPSSHRDVRFTVKLP